MASPKKIKQNQSDQIKSGEVFLKYLGATIAERRRALGLSQYEFAEAVGLHRSYMSDVERGYRNLGTINLLLIARALEWSLADLVGRAEEVMKLDEAFNAPDAQDE